MRRSYQSRFQMNFLTNQSFPKRERVLSFENWTWKRMMEEAQELDFRFAISPSERRSFWLIFKEYWKRKCNLWGAFIGFVVLRKGFKLNFSKVDHWKYDNCCRSIDYNGFFDKVSFNCTKLIQKSFFCMENVNSEKFKEAKPRICIKYYHVHHECSLK